MSIFLHQSNGLSPFATKTAYQKEAVSFKRQVRDCAVSQITRNASIVTSHVFYKVKQCEDGSLTLKAGIVVHGHKYLENKILEPES